jgi:hypothetical protein
MLWFNWLHYWHKDVNRDYLNRELPKPTRYEAFVSLYKQFLVILFLIFLIIFTFYAAF